MDDAASATALIVDDSLTVRMDLSEAFESAGFRVVACSTAEQARSALATKAIHLIVLDLVLPDASGAELLGEVRRGPAATIPVVMLSSEAEVRDRIDGLAAGADEYVGKPYDSNYVVARARALVNARRSTRAPAPILLVDDSLTSRQELGEALGAEGFHVLTAKSGEEGLMLASNEPPMAIIVDSMLPGIDGDTLIRRIRFDATLRSVPCMLLTATSDTDAELRALDAGADIFARKDEGTSVILAKLRVLLRRLPSVRDSVDLTSLAGAKKILAVDDSTTFREELADALRGEGYDVIQARCGEDAIELLTVQSVDCVLLDMVMPGLGGKATCQRLKASSAARDIPVVLLTALEDGQALVAGLEAGADDFVQKAAGFEVVKARVRAQLRRRQIEDETRRVRERLLKSELEAAEARATRELSETRRKLVEELQGKNHELEALARTKAELAESVQHSNAELEAAYGKLKSAQATLIQSAKMASLGELVAGVAHEINNPLAFVISHLATVRKRLTAVEPNVAEAGRQHWELAHARTGEMMEGLQRIKDLVAKLRTFSRLDEGEYKEISMRQCVDSVLTILGHRLNDGIRVSTEIGEPDRVTCYASLISQAIMNLVSNSIDAIDGEGSIRIQAGHQGDYYHIAIDDTGPGIPAELQARVIEPFFTTKPVGSGTGLGLSITYSIAEKHGGTFDLHSLPEGGTSAVIRFPIQP